MRAKNFLIIFGLVFLAAACNSNTAARPSVTIGGHKVNVEIAETDAVRQKGLGGRVSMGENEGMLFIFPQSGTYSFWMKDMQFPLDFIWISNGFVIEVTSNVTHKDQTTTYKPAKAVDSVLEVNAGWAGKNGIKVGDGVVLTR